MIKIYRYRVKNLHGELNRQARAVNYVWNYCNDVQRHAVKWRKQWPSAYDLHRLTAGCFKELGILSTTINRVCAQYCKSRAVNHKAWLRFRGRHSLRWVPLRAGNIRPVGDGFKVGGRLFHVFMSRKIQGIIKDGSSFSQDARGHWYLNIAVELPDVPAAPALYPVGIDLGLKELATLSTGEKITNPRHFAALGERLAIAQRARKKRQAANVHSRIANARRDHLHKVSTKITKEFDYIAVGNLNAAGLARTKMAKAVNDASWSGFRLMLRYKAVGRGGVYEEVDEKFTTQVCSSCGCTTGPKGVAGLRIRQWICSDCGTEHDRDVNAARNILARSGHRALVEGAAA